MSKILLPYEGRVEFESRFGQRTLNGTNDWHNGIDLVGLDSKIIIAPCDGYITSSKIITDKENKTWEWGNYIRLDNEYGLQIFLCHMSVRFVEEGEFVKTGQPLGIEGNTGYSFGNHCHFEIRSNGTILNPCELLGIPNEWGIYMNDNDNITTHSWSKEAVQWALNEGILKGYEDGSLKLDKNITREEAIVLLHRAIKENGNFN